ncbi:TRL domain-containing protein [Pseudomonadota bacterium]
MNLIKLCVIAFMIILSGCTPMIQTQMGVSELTGVTEANWDTGTNIDLKDLKTGKACATNFLWLIKFGDYSINKAKKEGNITKVVSVSTETKGFHFFFIGSFDRCTIVRGI